MLISALAALALAVATQGAEGAAVDAKPAAEAKAEPRKVCYTSTPTGSRRPRKVCVTQAPKAIDREVAREDAPAEPKDQ